jgi:hypothetical protein
MIGRSIVDTTVRSSAATNTLNPTTAKIAAGARTAATGELVGLTVPGRRRRSLTRHLPDVPGGGS